MKNEYSADNQHITKKEMAARMNVTPRTSDAWMSKGLVPYRKIGRTVRFDWDEVREHLKLRSRPTVVPVVQDLEMELPDYCASALQKSARLKAERAKAKKNNLPKNNLPGSIESAPDQVRNPNLASTCLRRENRAVHFPPQPSYSD